MGGCSLHTTIQLTTSLQSEIIVPNVIDMTGPISGDTNIAAVIFGALFSIKPNAANELCGEKNDTFITNGPFKSRNNYSILISNWITQKKKKIQCGFDNENFTNSLTQL